jgi:hypothetical protein
MSINLHELFQSVFHGDDKTNNPKQRPTLENIVRIIYQHSSEKSGPWIAGGCGRQIALGENNFNDIDVWFNNEFQFRQVLNRLTDQFGYEMYETFSSDNAMTYQVGKFKVQLIRRSYYPTLDAVFDKFDFTCCQIAVNDDLTAYGPGIADAKNYVLKLNKFDSKAFLARYAKYVGYGYIMNPEEFLDIIEKQELNYEFDGSVFGY